MLRKIIVLEKRTESAFKNVNDSEKAEDDLPSAGFNYEKRFDNSKWYMLIFSGLSYIGVGIYAMITEPIEVYYKLWIPVSFFVYTGMVGYYIQHYYADKQS